jgi:hypothetical protein
VNVIEEASRRQPDFIFPAENNGPVARQLAELHRRQNEHPLWGCALLASFSQGALARDELRYVF